MLLILDAFINWILSGIVLVGGFIAWVIWRFWSLIRGDERNR